MPRGDKAKYTEKQESKADHIAEGYEARGVSEQEAERRAWATVNKDHGGGKKPGGAGRGRHTGNPAAHKGGKPDGKAAASRSAEDRSASGPEGGRDAKAQFGSWQVSALIFVLATREGRQRHRIKRETGAAVWRRRVDRRRVVRSKRRDGSKKCACDGGQS